MCWDQADLGVQQVLVSVKHRPRGRPTATILTQVGRRALWFHGATILQRSHGICDYCGVVAVFANVFFALFRVRVEGVGEVRRLPTLRLLILLLGRHMNAHSQVHVVCLTVGIETVALSDGTSADVVGQIDLLGTDSEPVAMLVTFLRRVELYFELSLLVFVFLLLAGRIHLIVERGEAVERSILAQLTDVEHSVRLVARVIDHLANVVFFDGTAVAVRAGVHIRLVVPTEISAYSLVNSFIFL